jgi:putative hydrolase
MMLYDFHTHSYHSDGELSPLELIRRACVNGYGVIAITDHLALGSLERVIKEVSRDCELAKKYWDIMAFAGVELTHLPPEAIDDLAREARTLGAKVVVVHGESIAEPVAEGTNMAAVKSSYVDILAHPGLITDEAAAIAAEKGIFLELSGRKAHSSTNRHVALISARTGAKMIVDSDAHDEDDLLTEEKVETILEKAGVIDRRQEILEQNPRLLMEKILSRSDKLV